MTDHFGSTPSAASRKWALVLLAVAALPDVLPYPGMKTLVSERFGLGDAGTQLFAIAALFGALLGVPLLRRARRWSPARLFAIAALIQGCSIAPMALEISWPLMLLLRGIQGFADLLLLVTLTTIVASDPHRIGRGFGLAGSGVMVGLGLGLALGGVIASIALELIFPVAAGIAFLLAICAWGLPRSPVRSAQTDRNRRRRDRKVILAGGFSASDRMVSGMLTISLPLLLVVNFDATPRVIGMILAGPLLACALGGYFSGWLVDRIGAIPVRMIAVPVQAVGIAVIVLSEGIPALLLLGSLGLSVGASALMPTSLVIGTGRSVGDVSLDTVGGIQALGQAGHLFGVVLILLTSLYFGAVTNWSVLGILAFYCLWNAGMLGYHELHRPVAVRELDAVTTRDRVTPTPGSSRLRRPIWRRRSQDTSRTDSSIR